MIRVMGVALATACAASQGGSPPPIPPPACEAPADVLMVRRSIDTMGTRVDLHVPAADAAVLDEVVAAFERVDLVANEWRVDSPLAALNRAAGGPDLHLPADLMALLRRSRDLAELTDGAFDPTWAALWGLWDFHAAQPMPPDPTELQRRAAMVGWSGLRVDEAAGRAGLDRAGMVVGLGGVAKGWALDQAAAVLHAHAVCPFSLSAGGQVLVHGTRGDRPWQVGVRDPRGSADNWFAVLGVVDGSVSTSGDYERFFEHEGTRYHHILDPRTGWPSRGLRSVTVVAPDATTADALSTALMVAGPARAEALLGRFPGTSAVLVDEAGAVHALGGPPLRVHHPPLRN